MTSDSKNLQLSAFFAYPSRPPEIGVAIRLLLKALKAAKRFQAYESWEENDVPGRFIVDPVLQKISAADLVFGDISTLNFNVVYELGYAIGCLKRVLPIRNRALTASDRDLRETGIFDTLGYSVYSNSEDLETIVKGAMNADPLRLPTEIDRAAPIFLVSPPARTDYEIRLTSRLKKARLPFRSFDPEEHGRLSIRETLHHVTRSYGIAATLLPAQRPDATVHNTRVAFVAGLSLALEKEILLLQQGDDPVPLDYRDLVTSVLEPRQIDAAVHNLAAAVSARLTAQEPAMGSLPTSLLEKIDLGASSAENELQALGAYFLETDQFYRALRGEVQVVTGRKGAGKTALFLQLRNRLRNDPRLVVLDLRPEGYQLLKFKSRVLDLMDAGTKEHTITAFWEYLLLLEVCHKLLANDRQRHMRDHRLFEAYRALADVYSQDEFVAEGDFAERMLQLTLRIENDFQEFRSGGSESSLDLNREQVTELLYKHDVPELQAKLVEYLALKDSVWILVDNLDKGWPPHGVKPDDLLTLRCLLDSMRKLERSFSRQGVSCRGMIFIRNDVYELLLDSTPDRGKVARVSVDWTDPDLLREVLRRRLTHRALSAELSFNEVWSQLAASHIRGEETSQYLVERSLMRPRALIDLLQACRSHAVNVRHPRIEEEDFEAGEEAFSSNLVHDIGFEIRDVLPEAGDILYEFIEEPVRIPAARVREILQARLDSDKAERAFEILLWYGFLGLERTREQATYIFDLNYDLQRFFALIRKRDDNEVVFRINAAFHKALEIRVD